MLSELTPDSLAESAPERLAEAYKEKIVLVTGGAGFIGSNLVRRLLELETRNVVVLDDLGNAARHHVLGDLRDGYLRVAGALAHEREEEHQHGYHDDNPHEAVSQPLIVCHVVIPLYRCSPVLGGAPINVEF